MNKKLSAFTFYYEINDHNIYRILRELPTTYLAESKEEAYKLFELDIERILATYIKENRYIEDCGRFTETQISKFIKSDKEVVKIYFEILKNNDVRNIEIKLLMIH